MKRSSSELKLDPYIDDIASGIANDIIAILGEAPKMAIAIAVAEKVMEVRAMLEGVMPESAVASTTKEWIHKVLEERANCTYQNIMKWCKILEWKLSDPRVEEVLQRKAVQVAYRMASFFTRLADLEPVRSKAVFNLASQMPMSDREMQKFFALFTRDAVLFDWVAARVNSCEVLCALLKKTSSKGVIAEDLREGLLKWNFEGVPLSVVDIERISQETHLQATAEVVEDLKIAISQVGDEPSVVRANQSCHSCAYGSFTNLPGQGQQSKVGRCTHSSNRQNPNLSLWDGTDPGTHCGYWKITDRLSGKPKKDELEEVPEETLPRKEQEVYVAATQSPKAAKPKSQAYFKISCERFTFSSMAGWDAKSKEFGRLELAAISTLYGVAVQESEILKIEIADLRERIGNHLSEFLPQ
jgi:hypothetical protein